MLDMLLQPETAAPRAASKAQRMAVRDGAAELMFMIGCTL
jgi:hypothetical protein